MKYMMSCQHPITVLSEADEIKFEYRHKDRIDNLIKEDSVLCENIYIYITAKESAEGIDWDQLARYNKIFKLTLAFENLNIIQIGIANGFRSFWSYPVCTYDELHGLLNMGVAEVLVGSPLYFDIPQVKKVCEQYGTAELRLIANQCQNQNLPLSSAIYGTYIRPEDIPVYEQYVSHIEFITDTLTKEKTLITIYKSGEWPGNLNLLLNDLDYNIDNRLIESTFAQTRLSCRHRCQRDNSCHFCENMFTCYSALHDYYKKQKQTEG